MIPKQPLQQYGYKRRFHPTSSARNAFLYYLRTRVLAGSGYVLLPAYVGWSHREGSGVFDPIAALELPYVFYRMDSDLHIDVEDLESRLRQTRVAALVIVHYFGYVDPHYHDAIRLAARCGVPVLEDEAHALLTDLIGGLAGRDGEAALFSLPKLFPVQTGGMLVWNRDCDVTPPVPPAPTPPIVPWEFDMARIAGIRRENACLLTVLLQAYVDRVQPLRPNLLEGEVPQTYPVRLLRGCRDDIYVRLNALGFGVVSLYHTLIEQIPREQFPESYALSRCILNLPVHQDTAADNLPSLVEHLADLLA